MLKTFRSACASFISSLMQNVSSTLGGVFDALSKIKVEGQDLKFILEERVVP